MASLQQIIFKKLRYAAVSSQLAGCIRNPDLWARYMLTEHGKFDFTSNLHKIHCPVLHLAGGNDPVHPVSCAIDTAKNIGGNCELSIIKDTGDPVYRDKPKETVKVISDFITRLCRFS